MSKLRAIERNGHKVTGKNYDIKQSEFYNLQYFSEQFHNTILNMHNSINCYSISHFISL